MANEVRPWKKEGCAVSVAIADLTQREPHSREINEMYGEGGALNANYRTADAIARGSNILGKIGMVYGHDFVWKTAGLDEVSFDFANEEKRRRGEVALEIATKGFAHKRA